MLSVSEAITKILDNAHCRCETETIPAIKAKNRVLAEDAISTVNVPPDDNSAMDGYAIRLADAAKSQCLPISQRITAGMVAEPLEPGTTARIFTGAQLPPGADTVVMQENASVSENATTQNAGEHDPALGDSVQFLELPTKNTHVRPKGQDIKQGETVLRKGTFLRPQELGLLASIGIASVSVFKRLNVAILSTGSELTEPGQPLEPGHIYNSNRSTLLSLIESLGMHAIDMGICADNALDTRLALEDAAMKADVVITSGGVSVGEEDHVKAAVEELGTLDLWKVAIKPGKPFVLGTVLDSAFIGLPGNPASVFTTFLILARPFLLKSQGIETPRAISYLGKSNFSRKAQQRDQYLQANLTTTETGGNDIEIFPNQSSGVLSSTCWAGGFAVQPAGKDIEPGTLIRFFPYAELLAP